MNVALAAVSWSKAMLKRNKSIKKTDGRTHTVGVWKNQRFLLNVRSKLKGFNQAR